MSAMDLAVNLAASAGALVFLSWLGATTLWRMGFQVALVGVVARRLRWPALGGVAPLWMMLAHFDAPPAFTVVLVVGILSCWWYDRRIGDQPEGSR